jgi:hypothetical protein
MSQPTPGPWRKIEGMNTALYVVGPKNDGKRTTSDRICRIPRRDNGDGEANARLIAAAPEMLAFIQAFVASVNYHDEHDAEGFVQTMWYARKDARALLTKINV